MKSLNKIRKIGHPSRFMQTTGTNAPLRALAVAHLCARASVPVVGNNRARGYLEREMS